MEPGITKQIDFGEYVVIVTYYGDGKIDISVLDELGDEIEGIYISSDESDCDDFNFNLN
jgi:hypothetical protein